MRQVAHRVVAAAEATAALESHAQAEVIQAKVELASSQRVWTDTQARARSDGVQLVHEHQAAQDQHRIVCHEESEVCIQKRVVENRSAQLDQESSTIRSTHAQVQLQAVAVEQARVQAERVAVERRNEIEHQNVLLAQRVAELQSQLTIAQSNVSHVSADQSIREEQQQEQIQLQGQVQQLEFSVQQVEVEKQVIAESRARAEQSALHAQVQLHSSETVMREKYIAEQRDADQSLRIDLPSGTRFACPISPWKRKRQLSKRQRKPSVKVCKPRGFAMQFPMPLHLTCRC